MPHTSEQVKQALKNITYSYPAARKILSEAILDLRAQRHELLDVLQRLGSTEVFGLGVSSGLNGWPELSARIDFACKKLKELGAGVEIVAPPIEEDHPEATCDDCSGPNGVWFAPNRLWNRVARRSDGSDPMLCPRCFIVRAEAIGIPKIGSSAWMVVPADITLNELIVAGCNPYQEKV